MTGGEQQERTATIHWEGDSREVLASFPGAIRGNFGFTLFELQRGKQPPLGVRRMESIGPGVYELREADENKWYRLVYLAKIRDRMYVLHCFTKQSGKTDRRDLRIAAERLSRVRRRIQEQNRDAKHSRE